jgi:hypothetical protein
VREGIAAADRGELIEKEEIDARLHRCCVPENAHPLGARRSNDYLKERFIACSLEENSSDRSFPAPATSLLHPTAA